MSDLDLEDQRRLIIARTILAVRQAATEHYGSPDLFAILLAIGIGRVEGRPLDVCGVAALASTSRQTVLRAAAKMQEWGEIEIRREGRRTMLIMTAEHRQNPATRKFFERVAALIKRASKELSETDT